MAMWNSLFGPKEFLLKMSNIALSGIKVTNNMTKRK